MIAIRKKTMVTNQLQIGDIFPFAYTLDSPDVTEGRAIVTHIANEIDGIYDCLFVDCLPITSPMFEKFDYSVPARFEYTDVCSLLKLLTIKDYKGFDVVSKAYNGLTFTIPSVEEIIPYQERKYFDYIKDPHATLSPVMAYRRNRIAFLGDDSNKWCSYWCANARDSTNFTGIRGDGGLFYFDSQESHGIRPKFQIKLN